MVAGKRLSKKRFAVYAGVVLAILAAAAYSQKDRFSDQGAELSRGLIGDENTARVEQLYFRAQDRMDRMKYSVLGGRTNPFAATVVVQHDIAEPGRVVTIDLSKPIDTSNLLAPRFNNRQPLQLPQVRLLRDNPEQGEGVWTTAGLPRSTPEDTLMARTFVRPDKARPYALVGVLIVDARRIKLHMVGGTAHPGGDLGVKGPGAITQGDVGKELLLAWNGGFQGPHGSFGMVAEGKQYRQLRNGLASVGITKEGTLKMGEWGRSIGTADELVAVRQNAVLLVDNCEVSKRTAEGNDTWGYVAVNSAEFITWRSAIGLTKDGQLLVAAGNSLSAATLAQALWAAGACTAMQLDINSPYVLTSLFFPQPDGSVKSTKFMDAMSDNPARFLRTQERDFMYVTLDETRYK